MEKTIILSLGGSVICPDNIDVSFLKNFKKTVEKYVKKNYRFVIICGGGRLARQYQESASKIAKLSDSELDWLGIQATKINANLVKLLFREDAEDYILDDSTKKLVFNKPSFFARPVIPRSKGENISGKSVTMPNHTIKFPISRA